MYVPNRILKESICTSETIDQLGAFEEVFFYRLIVNCDDYGLMDARPAILKCRLFPLKEIRLQQIEDALRKLTSAELVSTYEVDGKPFLLMNTWDKHQQVRAAMSKYPGPDGKYMTKGSRVIPSEIIRNQMKSGDSKCSRNTYSYSEAETYSYSEAGSACAREDPPPPESMSASQYCEMCLRGMAPGNYEELKSFLSDGLSDGLIRFAVDDACGHGNRTWSYVAKILNRYVVQGIRTVDQARAEKTEHEKNSVRSSGKRVSAQDYEQRSYSEEELLAVSDDLLEEARRQRNDNKE